MKTILQVRKLYYNYQVNKSFFKDAKKYELKREIQRLIAIAVQEEPPKELFENSWILDILLSALKKIADGNKNVLPLVQAFKGLEKYILLLVQQPWKSEFKEIKMYGGFYRTKIKSVIPDCEQIFERAGYMVIPDKCTMRYRGHMDKTFLILLALDCRISQMECRTIVEHYNTVRGLPVTLIDVISDIFRDEYSPYDPAFRRSLKQKCSVAEDISVAVPPPAIPKRDPIIHSSRRHNIRLGNEPYYDADIFNVLDARIAAGVTIPSIPKHLTANLKSAFLQRPPLLTSGVTAESLAYINKTDEVIPDLPQGTCEDHMLETLRLVHQQDSRKSQEDRKLGNKSITAANQPNIFITSSNQPNIFTTTGTYSVSGPDSGNIIQKPGPSVTSVDEGIEPDLSTSTSKYFSSKYNSSIGSQQVLPNKHISSSQQISCDGGYRTGNPDSIYSHFSPDFMNNTQQTIYLPPNITPTGTYPALQRKTSLSRQNALPPPVPSRALKPTQNTEEDSLYSKSSTQKYSYSTSRTSADVKARPYNEAMVAHSTLSAPVYLTVPHGANIEDALMEDVLIRERSLAGKSRSLKIDPTSYPLSQQIAAARMARSMDMTFWECSTCHTLNATPHSFCSMCFRSYIEPSVKLPNKTQTMF